MLKTLQKGATIQLERRGYYIIDSAAFPAGKPMTLIKIPDGKAKDMGMKSKVDPSKLQGGAVEKAKKAALDAPPKAAGSPKAAPKAAAGGDAKKGGDAKAAPAAKAEAKEEAPAKEKKKKEAPAKPA